MLIMKLLFVALVAGVAGALGRKHPLSQLRGGGFWHSGSGGGGDGPRDPASWCAKDGESGASGGGGGASDGDDDDDDEGSAARAAQRWTRRAFEAAHAGERRAAASAFDKALSLTPDDAPYRAALLINAGSYLAFSGRSTEALAPLREAAATTEEEPRALHALGNARAPRRRKEGRG
jgi:tetratricopeptide (TPR) repeat protein